MIALDAVTPLSQIPEKPRKFIRMQMVVILMQLKN